MLRFNIYILFILISFQTISGQNNIIGIINPGEGLENVNISIQEINRFTTASDKGHSSFSDLPNGTYNLIF